VAEAAFGIGTAITSTLHVGVSIWLLRRRLGGRIGGRALLRSFIKTGIASAASAVAAWFALRWLGGFDLGTMGRVGGRAVRVFMPLGAGGTVYVLISAAMQMEELRWLIPGRREAAGTTPREIGTPHQPSPF
jgi:peptidoglycan biosynthesis protein MviN/MurJ (putative lipid II flippase)